jgi:hypothetical protein
MIMNRESSIRTLLQAIGLLLGMLSGANFLVPPANSRERNFRNDPRLPLAGQFATADSAQSDANHTSATKLSIPLGTILPVRLNSTISSVKSKPGQAVTGRIMQDVPLPHGAKIRAGSKVTGHILEVTQATGNGRGSVSLQFDKVSFSNQTIAVTTNLRALAGFMAVLEAQIPPIGPSESDVYRWLTTVQVGGDVVYGEGGVVTAGENANEIVGKSVYGGVLGQVKAKRGTKCRGALYGNDSPQALWVFSTDACGTYGLERISIAHAGRTDPLGVIVLTSDAGNLKIVGGAGMLLRVNTGSHN